MSLILDDVQAPGAVCDGEGVCVPSRSDQAPGLGPFNPPHNRPGGRSVAAGVAQRATKGARLAASAVTHLVIWE